MDKAVKNVWMDIIIVIINVLKIVKNMINMEYAVNALKILVLIKQIKLNV